MNYKLKIELTKKERENEAYKRLMEQKVQDQQKQIDEGKSKLKNLY